MVSRAGDVAPVKFAQILLRYSASLLLAALLGYLLLRQVIDPGFTHFWGYQVSQVTLTLLILFLGEAWSSRGQLWSWETRTIVVTATYADCFGTAGHLYDRYAIYDKITHFAAGAVFAAICYETVEFLRRQEILSAQLASSLLIAVCFSLFCGIAWEVYEYLGDAMFHTRRVQSWADTFHDLFSDTAGAVVAGLLVSRRATRNAVEPARSPVAGSQGLRVADEPVVANQVNADLP